MDLERLSRLPPWNWPRDAPGMLLERLLDAGGDARGRLLAAELAGRPAAMNDQLVRALTRILRAPGEEPSLRGTAASALGSVLDEIQWRAWDDVPVPPRCSEEVVQGARRTLAEVYRDAAAPEEVRRAALEASVQASESWHAGAVRAAYHGGDPKWRRTAVACMYHVGGFAEEIVDALSSEDAALVREAARAAQSWGVEEAWPRIRALLLDTGTERLTLVAAIEAASSVGADPGELAQVLTDLMGSADPAIAEAATDAAMDVIPWDDAGCPDPDGYRW